MYKLLKIVLTGIGTNLVFKKYFETFQRVLLKINKSLIKTIRLKYITKHSLIFYLFSDVFIFFFVTRRFGQHSSVFLDPLSWSCAIHPSVHSSETGKNNTLNQKTERATSVRNAS